MLTTNQYEDVSDEITEILKKKEEINKLYRQLLKRENVQKLTSLPAFDSYFGPLATPAGRVVHCNAVIM